MIAPAWAALQFLTRLPAPMRRHATLEDVGRSLAWFPVVGALLGGVLVVLDRAAQPLLAAPVANALLLTALVAASGALHLDGWIDAVDGLTAGDTPAARLAAMRQTVVGSTGVIAACLLLVTDYLALSGLDGAVRPPALFLAPLCGRTAILLAYHLYPYGRAESGLSGALKRGASRGRTLGGLAVAAALAGGAAGPGGLLALALALVLMHGLASLALTRVPGLTGDIYGAICEVVQLGVWLAAPAIIHP
jgi:adenosylcobinamide-GDP ribazoletransferase